VTRKKLEQPAHHQHAVQFYENELSLFKTVAGFLGQGLVDEQPGIMIATAPHRAAIVDRLKARLIDIDAAQRSGTLIVLDAAEALSLFMVNGMPDPVAFDTHIGTIVTDLLRGRPAHTMIRAYGEMVDVLWKDGKPDAAIRLEMLWNKLAAQHGFALLCGYAMGNFYKETVRFEEVCRQHAHIVAPEPAATPLPPHYDIQ
jgi:DcmR-like sensory protein